MFTMLKKAISLFVVGVFVFSLIPVTGLAEAKDDTIPVLAAGYVTDGSNANKSPYMTNTDYVTSRNSTGTNLRYSFVQYDLSDWWKYLQVESTSIDYKLHAGGPFGSTKAYAYSVYILPGDYNLADLTFNNANALGLFDVSERTPIAQFTDNTGIKDIVHSYENIDRAVLLDALKQGTTGVITLLIKSDYANDQSYFYPGKSGTGFVVSYDDDFDGDAEFLSDATADFSWSKVTDEDTAAVTKATKLPSKYNGVNVTWTSSENGAIDENGNIIQSREITKTLTLTATFTCGTASPVTKTFDIEVLKIEPVSISVNYDQIVQINAKNLETVVPFNSSTYYMTSGAMYDANQGSRGDERVFINFNLADYKKYIDVATGFSLNIGNRSAQGTDGVVTLLNDRSDNWDSTLTYNMAVDSGMYTDPGLFTAYNVPFNVSKTTVSDAALLDGVKAALAQDPDEGIITFRLAAAYTNLNKFQINGTAGKPYVEITYYEDDVLSDEEFAASKAGTVAWDAVSHQDMDNVVADLTLPATWYGQAVTWTSSDETAITSSGEVIIGEAVKAVTLTATVNGTPNVFNVTVPACKIAVKSDRTHTQSGSNLNYSTAYIYANEDIAGEYTILLATYSSQGELSNITVAADDYEIKEGLNIMPSTYHYAVADAATKVIIVDNMESLKPLTVAG